MLISLGPRTIGELARLLQSRKGSEHIGLLELPCHWPRWRRHMSDCIGGQVPHIQTGTRASTRTKQHWTRAARNRVHGTETHGPGWTDHGEVPQVPRPRTFDFDTRRLLSPNSRAARVDLAWSLPGCDGESGPGGTWRLVASEQHKVPLTPSAREGSGGPPQKDGQRHDKHALGVWGPCLAAAGSGSVSGAPRPSPARSLSATPPVAGPLSGAAVPRGFGSLSPFGRADGRPVRQSGRG